jgi:hypothetical protein
MTLINIDGTKIIMMGEALKKSKGSEGGERVKKG